MTYEDEVYRKELAEQAPEPDAFPAPITFELKPENRIRRRSEDQTQQ
ncbi:MAG: hypothetical protein ACFB21_07095 [Opitutales bacterium]